MSTEADMLVTGDWIDYGSPVSVDITPPIYPQSGPVYDKYSFCPELNFWTNNIIDNCSPIQQTYLRKPVPVDENEWRCNGSILDLLFNYTYDAETCGIFYESIPVSSIQDPNIKQRYGIFAGRLNYFTCDSTATMAVDIFPSDTTQFAMSAEIIPDGRTEDSFICPFNGQTILTGSTTGVQNIFDITFGELDMLNLLKSFKQGLLVSLTGINFDLLPSNLSKLIYIYLNFELNEDLTIYDTNDPITSGDRLIEWIFEKWVLDCLYRNLKFMPSLVFGCNGSLEEVRKSWRLMAITQNNINDKAIEFPSDRIPIDEDRIFLVHDAKTQKLKEDYDYLFESSDSTSVVSAIIWDSLNLENKISVGDVIYLLWSHRMATP